MRLPRCFISVLGTLALAACAVVPEPAEVSHGDIRFVEESNGAGLLSSERWTYLRFDVQAFRINDACYNTCRLRFTLDAHLPNDTRRTHIGIIPGQTVQSDFIPPDNFGNLMGFAGAGPFPPDMNLQIGGFTVEEKLALAWIVVNAEELISSAAATGRMDPDVAQSWAADAERFERDLRRAMRGLAPYIRAIEA